MGARGIAGETEMMEIPTPKYKVDDVVCGKTPYGIRRFKVVSLGYFPEKDRWEYSLYWVGCQKAYAPESALFTDDTPVSIVMGSVADAEVEMRP